MAFNIYDFTSFTQSIDEALFEWLPPFWAMIVEMTIIGLVFLLAYAIIGLFLVYAERKVCAFMQNRVGPNRVGPYGFFQTIADFIKLLMKELVYIKNSDKLLFNIAPFIVIIASFMAIAAPAIGGVVVVFFFFFFFFFFFVSWLSYVLLAAIAMKEAMITMDGRC